LTNKSYYWRENAVDSRFEDTRIDERDESLREDMRDKNSILNFYNDSRSELFKLEGRDCDDERYKEIINAYRELSVDGRLTKDISGSDFSRIQEGRFEKLPRTDVRSADLRDDGSVSGRAVSLYADKVSRCDLSASPALAYGLQLLSKDGERDMVDDKYAAISIGSFIKTLTPEERGYMIPRTADESREYSESTLNTDGRFDYIARSLTGTSNINMEMLDKLADTLREDSGKDDPRCVIVNAGNGVLGYGLEQAGLRDVVSTDRYGNDYNPNFNVADCRYCDVKQLDFDEAAREYGRDADYVIIDGMPYDDRSVSEMIKELSAVNDDVKIICIGSQDETPDAFEQLREVDSDDIREVDELHVPYPGEDSSIVMYEIKSDERMPA